MDNNKKSKYGSIIGGVYGGMIAKVGLKQFLKGKEEFDGTITLYHGTSKSNAEKILNEGALKSGKKTSFNNILAYDNDSVYLSRDKAATKSFSKIAEDIFRTRKKMSPSDVIRKMKIDFFGKEGKVLKYKVPTKVFQENFKIDPETYQILGRKNPSFLQQAMNPEITERFVHKGDLNNKFLSKNVSKKNLLINKQINPMRSLGKIKMTKSGLMIGAGLALSTFAAYQLKKAYGLDGDKKELKDTLIKSGLGTVAIAGILSVKKIGDSFSNDNKKTVKKTKTLNKVKKVATPTGAKLLPRGAKGGRWITFNGRRLYIKDNKSKIGK